MNPVIAHIDKQIELNDQFGLRDAQFVEMRLDGFRQANHGWYKQIKDKDGVEAAEAALADYAAKSHMHEFSDSIMPIVMGVRALAENDPGGKNVYLVEDTTKLKYPVSYDLNSSGDKLIVAENPERRFHCCNEPIPGDYIWRRSDGQYGTLGLKAIVIGLAGMHRIVDLVLPYRRNARLPVEDRYETVVDGYTIVRIDRQGSIHNEELKLSVRHGYCFGVSMGKLKEDHVLAWGTAGGGSLSEHLDIPDAQDYLAKHIPTLGPYLSAVAKEIAEHKAKEIPSAE